VWGRLASVGRFAAIHRPVAVARLFPLDSRTSFNLRGISRTGGSLNRLPESGLSCIILLGMIVNHCKHLWIVLATDTKSALQCF
jgi:hypothetical protein